MHRMSDTIRLVTIYTINDVIVIFETIKPQAGLHIGFNEKCSCVQQSCRIQQSYAYAQM